MPTDLEQSILKVLRGMKAGDRPATIGDLARRLGASANLVSSCARQMVDKGLAEPSMIGGPEKRTLHGLLPQPTDASKR